MYRVIFLFSIDDVYADIDAAIKRLRTRRVVVGKTPDLIRNWFLYHLHQDLHLAIWEGVSEDTTSQFDEQFRSETSECEVRLYRQLSLPIFYHARPCTESWCHVQLDRRTLRLTFDVGPIDYGARLA